MFAWIAGQGGLAQSELLKTFNAGIGMVVAVPADRADAARDLFTAAGEEVIMLGHVVAGDGVQYSGKLL